MSHTMLIRLLYCCLPVFFILALNTGSTNLAFIAALQDVLAGNESADSIILTEVRLPRALLAILVGASLALSGAALQGLLHNPLSSPGLLGVSQSAALAAVITLYYGAAALAWFVLPLAAMTGAAVSVLFISVLAGRLQNNLSLILAGIAINAITGSLTSLALNFAPNPYALQEIFYWMLGSVANRSLNDVWFALPFMIIGWILILNNRRFLDAMSLGEEAASALGFNIRTSRWLIIAGVASCTGAAVAVSGNIGFVGLIVPHLLRPLIKAEPGKLLFLSMAGGAVLVLLADILVQTLTRGSELQLGVITAAVGGPFFLYLIYTKRHLLS